MIDFVLSTDANRCSRGYGWASYPSHGDALTSLCMLRGKLFLGNLLCVCFARFDICCDLVYCVFFLSLIHIRRRGTVYDPRAVEKETSLFVKGVAVGTTPSHFQHVLSKHLQSECIHSIVIPQVFWIFSGQYEIMQTFSNEYFFSFFPSFLLFFF
jgi:hypothetical protein